jgi:hypothetical protein
LETLTPDISRTVLQSNHTTFVAPTAVATKERHLRLRTWTFGILTFVAWTPVATSAGILNKSTSLGAYVIGYLVAAAGVTIGSAALSWLVLRVLGRGIRASTSLTAIAWWDRGPATWRLTIATSLLVLYALGVAVSLVTGR